MNTHNVLRLAVVLAGFAAVSPAMATSVTLGNPANPATGTSLPFGSNQADWGGEYQQAYDRTAFGTAPVLLDAISFSTFQIAGQSASVAAGTYTISLASTADFLNLSNTLASNLNNDKTVVFSGVLPMLSNGVLAINFTHAFLFNPSANNDLVLDIVSTDAAAAAPLYFDLTTGAGPAGVVTARVDPLIGYGDQTGLVTAFDVPEPSSMIVLASSLLGLGFARRRRT